MVRVFYYDDRVCVKVHPCLPNQESVALHEQMAQNLYLGLVQISSEHYTYIYVPVPWARNDCTVIPSFFCYI